MNLFVKKIVLEKDGKTTDEYNFNNTLTVVSGSAELYDIIRLLLGIRESARSFHNVKFYAVVELDEMYHIHANKNKGDSFFSVSINKADQETDCTEEYFQLVQQNKELDSSLFFNHFKRQDYPHKLFKYRDLLKYYPDRLFAELTNGYGTTRSFRGFVTSYIKHFKPIKLCEKKQLFLKLSKTGTFTVGYLDDDQDVCLSQSENMLYNYLSFISVADFWARAERIRNLNLLNKPLVISCFLQFFDETIDLNKIVRYLSKIDRQVILMINN